MTIYTYEATVRVSIPNYGGTTTVITRIQAANEFAAKSLLESQYGQGNVLFLPQRVT